MRDYRVSVKQKGKGIRFLFKREADTFFFMGNNYEEEDAGGGLAVQEGRPKLKEPPQFAVILHNDDYTTMEFVIEVLQRYFHKAEEEAVQIMLKVHQYGKGIAGIYHFEIAETKVVQVQEYARGKGFPLKCTAEPA